LAADLEGGQAEVLADGAGGRILQGAAEPQGGVLEDVVGLLPAPDARVALEHLAGEPGEPLAGGRDQLVAGRRGPGPEPVEPALDGGRLVVGHGRAPVPPAGSATGRPAYRGRRPPSNFFCRPCRPPASAPASGVGRVERGKKARPARGERRGGDG